MRSGGAGLSVSRVVWKPTYRLVPSRFPPISIYERVADPADLDAIFAIENLTNERLRQEAGDIQLVPPGDRISGTGTSPIMAAFTHLNPEGSRFSDGTYGAYYAGKDLETAITETAFHRARFLARTKEAPCEIDMRSYKADLDAELTDIRGQQARLSRVYDPESYVDSQRFGREDRASGSYGIVFDSVRHTGGECVAIFKPKALAPCVQGPHYTYVWDGTSITSWYQKGDLRRVRV